MKIKRSLYSEPGHGISVNSSEGGCEAEFGRELNSLSGPPHPVAFGLIASILLIMGEAVNIVPVHPDSTILLLMPWILLASALWGVAECFLKYGVPLRESLPGRNR